MHFDVFTVLPELFSPYLQASILQKAIERALLSVQVHDIRAYTHDRHHVTDDAPYGGGGGMVMKPEPIFEAVESVLGASFDCPLIYLSPQGKPFTTQMAMELAAVSRIALLCGRYEGIDERVLEHLVTEQVSVGDFVVTGGELPALMVIDAVARFLPGVLGDPDGAVDDSFSNGLLEYPHYTRPPEFRGWGVPDVLLSGNHAEIARWRHEQSIIRTLANRPDLLEQFSLTEEDRSLLQKFKVNGEEP
ncbi:MAG TPA: tRNA (guanosine(37)-N1)-methyltransferase TrmD [Anaerolineaceae bacterium]|nr:tRNA (guanosine(37)-N1)-methyltransferase TrmD [Anaerolineaceae bacterium]